MRRKENEDRDTGSACVKCKRLHKNVEKALKKNSVQAEVVKVEDINEILNRES